MRLFRKLRGSRNQSTFPQSAFSFQSRHVNELSRLVDISRTPQVSIHFEILGQTPQVLTLRCHQADLPVGTLGPQSYSNPNISPRESHDPQIITEGQGHSQNSPDEAEFGSNARYAIGSYIKILINVAFLRLIRDERYKHFGLSWEQSACDVFNINREKKGKSTILRTWGNPEIRQLLIHKNGFAPMNQLLLAPDGTFIMSEAEFIKVAPLVTDDRYKNKYPERGWIEYSNCNHIFAAMILEEVTGRRLCDLMHELVFDWLDMTQTIMNEESLASEAVKASIVNGYRVSAEGSQSIAPQSPRMSDIVEVGSLGVYSSTDDIAKLNRAFLKGIEGGLESKFQTDDVTDFFTLHARGLDTLRMALAGLFGAMDSDIPGDESLKKDLIPTTKFSPFKLGKRPDGSRCNVYYKGGTVDGFTMTTYLSLNDRAFVVVLGNSTGPIEVTDYIARYIFQEAFRLSPSVNIVSSAIKEGRICSNRLLEIEREDLDRPEWSGNIEDLVGTYKHVRYLQQLTITDDGALRIHGTTKTSSPMKLRRISPNIVRILPGVSGFGIDRWSVWSNLNFQVNLAPNGQLSLLGNDGLDRYLKIS